MSRTIAAPTPPTVLAWSTGYLLHATGAPPALARAAQYASFPLRFLDAVGPRRNRADASSGVSFFGRRSESAIGPKDMAAYYDNSGTTRVIGSTGHAPDHTSE